MEFLKNFFEDVKDVDVRKQAKWVRNRFQHMPEVRQQRTFEMKDLLLGIAIGSVIGYLASLLFAPRSGRETRAYLSDKSRELGHAAKETVDEAANKAGRLVDEGRERVESTLHKGRKEIEDTKQQGRDTAYTAREKLSDTLDRAADEVDPNTRF